MPKGALNWFVPVAKFRFDEHFSRDVNKKQDLVYKNLILSISTQFFLILGIDSHFDPLNHHGWQIRRDANRRFVRDVHQRKHTSWSAQGRLLGPKNGER